ncbi:MAG: hypothetical protein QOD72_3364, partial [Acidimicrobiaceae bacterium]|nr:hypothetical protein [Acidimicrobiaceae bacterium]
MTSAMRRWTVGYVVAALPLVIASFALPRYHVVFWGLLGWSASAAILVGVWKNRPAQRWPWLLVAAAMATFVTGDVAYDLLTDVWHFQDPFPSVADAFYLMTYVLLACGLLGLVRARSRERDLGPLLDALIITASSALLSWLYLIEPYVRATDMSVFEKVVSISYPLGDIAILCVLARLILAGGLRNWSVRLLTLGALGLLVADVLYGDSQLNGTWQVGGPVDLGWVLFYVCWGAASLHPSMRELTKVQQPREKHLSMTALVVLSGATLVAPGLLVWRASTGAAVVDGGVIGATSGVVFLLVMARLTSLARAQSAQVTRERALRTVGERLVAASQLDEVDSVAVAAVQSLVGARVIACVVTVPQGRLERVVAAHPSELMGALFDRDGADDSSAAHLAVGTSVPGCTSTTIWSGFSFGGTNYAERRVLIGHHGRLPQGMSDVENALAAQLTLAADRVQLAGDLHQRKSEARFRSLIRNATDVILVVQANGDVRSETPSIGAVLGYSADAGPMRLSALVHPDDGPTATASIEAVLAGTHVGPMYGEWRVRHTDGRWLNMEVVGNDLSEDPEVRGIVLTMRDVSERRVLEHELRHQAFHDSLTGLANRVLFYDRVDHALNRRARLGNDVCVLLVDIDDFKVVNDAFGHAAGDELLVQFSRRLLDCLRVEDTAARLGGDEFAVCIEGEAREPNVSAIAQRILDAMTQPFVVAATEVNAHVSIGISMAGDNTEGSIGMLREADLALYAAKNAGKSKFHFFETSLHNAVLARLERRAALELAIDNDQLCLHYQPILNLDDGTIVGVEALVRWNHPTMGLIPPIEFIPLAEDSGLVIPLGQWVLNQACADLSRWQRRWTATAAGPFAMAVNVSPRQLHAADFLTIVDDTISRHQIDPSWLTFEITESVLVQDSPDVMTRLDAVHDLGISLALDDFGTGYSSLSYLHRFPIQILKIDRSFVNGMDEDNVSAGGTTLIKAIVSMAESLGLDLVA